MFEKVKELLAKQLKKDPAVITMDATIKGDLGADSVEHRGHGAARQAQDGKRHGHAPKRRDGKLPAKEKRRREHHGTCDNGAPKLA